MPIYLGVILARKSSTPMGAPAAVSVHNDLTACQTRVSHGAADHEVAAGVDVVLGVGIEVLLGDGRVDDLTHNIFIK